MARTTRDPRARATLKHMAEVWIRLAEADVKETGRASAGALPRRSGLPPAFGERLRRY